MYSFKPLIPKTVEGGKLLKKVIIISLMLLTGILVAILVIRTGQPDSDVTSVKTKVGLIVTCSKSDNNFCQGHYDALKSLEDELNLEIICREHVPDDCYNYVDQLIREEGCRIIVGASFQYGEALKKAADINPDIIFFHPAGTFHQKNYSSCFGRLYQVRYLSGIIAGMQTETGEIGYVASFPITEVIRGINAFTLGVRSVRPDAVVHACYSGSWNDDELTGGACRNLLDSYNIDVVTVHSNSMEVNREADRRGIWSIGCNLDNRAMFPDTYLTACVINWESYYKKAILDCLQHKFHGENVWLGMDSGITSLSPFSEHVDERTTELVHDAEEKILSRRFDVFYGPVKDDEGNTRIEAGESMSDDDMLNGFNWYVEGVTVEE